MAKRKKKDTKTKVKRKRLSREQAKQQMTRGGGGGNWFNLPQGVDCWAPEKKGRYMIDILPYEVSTDNHPEEGIELGVLWFRTQFRIHRGIGIKEQSVVCPRSVGKKCAICDEADRLRKEDRDGNKEAIDQLRGQLYVAMNIKHPDDPDTIAILAMSYGKFAKKLKEELQEEENEEHLDFYQCDEGGRTLRVRFSEQSFRGNKYLEATSIDFKKREEMDEDEILEKVVNLDSILNVPSSEKIEAMFLEGEEDDDDDDDEGEEEEVKPKPKKRGAKRKPAKKDEDEEEEEDEIPEGMIECVACEGSGKSSKGKKCTPCKGKGYLPEPEDEEDEEEEDEDIEDDDFNDDDEDNEEEDEDEDWDDDDEEDDEEDDDDWGDDEDDDEDDDDE